jgi:IPP transferase
VYKGLDIVTNKVSSEEMAEVPHHLIDILSPLDQFNIVDYRNLALAKVTHSHSTNRAPTLASFFPRRLSLAKRLYLKMTFHHALLSIIFIPYSK